MAELVKAFVDVGFDPVGELDGVDTPSIIAPED